jgi:hypothetical protein
MKAFGAIIPVAAVLAVAPAFVHAQACGFAAMPREC